jgi:ATP-dependent Lon protease
VRWAHRPAKEWSSPATTYAAAPGRKRASCCRDRGIDTSPKSGANLAVPTLLALASALIGKSLRGGLICAGHVNLGGAVDPIHNAVSIAELAVEKGATTLLLPVTSRRQLVDLSDDMAAKLAIAFFTDARDAFLKAVMD